MYFQTYLNNKARIMKQHKENRYILSIDKKSSGMYANFMFGRRSKPYADIVILDIAKLGVDVDAFVFLVSYYL